MFPSLFKKKVLICLAWFCCCSLVPAAAPKWRLDRGVEYAGAPAWHGGRLVFALHSGAVLCLDSGGKVRWEKEYKESFFAPPVIDEKGVIFTASTAGRIRALDMDGHELWQVKLEEPVYAAPLLTPGGMLVIGQKGALCLLDPRTGAVTWTKELNLPVFVSAAADRKRGRIFVAVEDFLLVCLDNAGNLIWKAKTVGANHSSPSPTPTGEVYLASMDHRLYKFSPEGRLLWTFAAERWIKSSPVLDRHGNACFGSYDGNFYCISPEGKLVWKFTGKAAFASTAAIDDKGNVYTGDMSGTVYGLSPGGKLLWQFKTKDFVNSGFTIIPENRLLIAGNISGEVFAFSLPAKLSGKALWPKHLGDLRNGCLLE